MKDPTGYIKTVLDLKKLEDEMKGVLIVLALYCGPDMTLRVRDLTQDEVREKLGWSDFRARKGFARLEAERLLTKMNKQRVVHWKLPTEDQLIEFAA